MLISTPEIIAIYESYPRKVAKPKALKAIFCAVAKDGYEHVKKMTEEFTVAFQSSGKSLEFIPYPATFFNQERYNDDFSAVFPPPSTPNTTQSVPIWQRIKATEAALAALQKTEPAIPSVWLTSKAKYDQAVELARPWYSRRKQLKALLEELNQQLAGI